jgi:hypothetical protein
MAALASLAVVGLAVNAAYSGPVVNYGALTPPGVSQIAGITGVLYNTFAASVTTGTIAAGILTGATTIYLNSASTTPGNQTTRTAAQLIADLTAALGFPVPIGYTWEITITQTGAGTMTLVAGTNVTLTGTMTIANATTRQFVGQVTSATAVTITSVGTGTYS